MQTGARELALTIPATAGYLVLARLGLAAVCRLTTLQPDEVADLKLAVTEASNEFIADGHDGHQLAYVLQLGADRLVVRVTGTPPASPSPDRELSRAIIAATVDESDFSPGRTMLTKRLAPGAA